MDGLPKYPGRSQLLGGQSVLPAIRKMGSASCQSILGHFASALQQPDADRRSPASSHADSRAVECQGVVYGLVS
jgi:hypothetical protein